MKYYIFIFFLLFIISCYEVKETSSSQSKRYVTPEWYGFKVKDVTERFGNPNHIIIDSSKNKYYLFLKKDSYLTNFKTINNLNDSVINEYISTNYFTNLLTFLIDSNNIVRNSKFYNNDSYNPSSLYFKQKNIILKELVTIKH
jgi:hypothetical protein